MTTTEAIKELKARKEHYEMGDGCEFLVEALDIAINVMENLNHLVDCRFISHREIEMLNEESINTLKELNKKFSCESLANFIYENNLVTFKEIKSEEGDITIRSYITVYKKGE